MDLYVIWTNNLPFGGYVDITSAIGNETIFTASERCLWNDVKKIAFWCFHCLLCTFIAVCVPPLLSTAFLHYHLLVALSDSNWCLFHVCCCFLSLCTRNGVDRSNDAIIRQRKKWNVPLWVRVNCSLWPCGLRRKSERAWLLLTWVRIPLKSWIFVSPVCWMLCRYRPLHWADNSSIGVLPCVCD